MIFQIPCCLSLRSCEKLFQKAARLQLKSDEVDNVQFKINFTLSLLYCNLALSLIAGELISEFELECHFVDSSHQKVCHLTC